jgi:hypothetical protein
MLFLIHLFTSLILMQQGGMFMKTCGVLLAALVLVTLTLFPAAVGARELVTKVADSGGDMVEIVLSNTQVDQIYNSRAGIDLTPSQIVALEKIIGKRITHISGGAVAGGMVEDNVMPFWIEKLK